MKKLIFVVAALSLPATGWTQQAVPAPSPNEVEALRQEVQALTETVKGLQQQLKEQQDALAKMNAGPTTLPASETSTATSSSTPVARRQRVAAFSHD